MDEEPVTILLSPSLAIGSVGVFFFLILNIFVPRDCGISADARGNSRVEPEKIYGGDVEMAMFCVSCGLD